MMSMRCECDKCGIWVEQELSVAEATFETPEGFYGVTSNTKTHTLCTTCFEKLSTVLAEATDEFVAKGVE